MKPEASAVAFNVLGIALASVMIWYSRSNCTALREGFSLVISPFGLAAQSQIPVLREVLGLGEASSLVETLRFLPAR